MPKAAKKAAALDQTARASCRVGARPTCRQRQHIDREGGRRRKNGVKSCSDAAARPGRSRPAPLDIEGDFARLVTQCVRKKLQPCAWCHVAKVGPTDPASCMRCYISVLRLNRPQSAILFGFNWGLKLSAAPLRPGTTCAACDHRDGHVRLCIYLSLLYLQRGRGRRRDRQ